MLPFLGFFCKALAIALFLISVPNHSAAGQEVLKIGVERDYPPFSIVDAQGNFSGFDLEIANALCRDMKRDCVIQPMEFQRLLDSMKERKLDMVIAGLAVKPDRQQYMEFSNNYYQSRSIYVFRPEAELTEKWMRGKTIGMQENTAQQNLAERLWKGIAVFKTFPDHPTMLEALKAGKVDVLLVDGLAAYSFLLSEEGAAYEMSEILVDADSPTNNACIGVRKGDLQLLSDVNNSLANIKLSGEYSRIARKYFPFSIY